MTQATLSSPCTVTSCNYHLDQYTKLGLKPKCPTNCIAEDFHKAYDDDLDYAIKESGRVGYRDLEYLAIFFQTTPEVLKVLYETGIDQMRMIMLMQYYSMEIDLDSTCQQCGRRKCGGLKDTQISTYLDSLLITIRPMLNTMMTQHQMYACIWYDYRNKKELFKSDTYDKLKEFYNA